MSPRVLAKIVLGMGLAFGSALSPAAVNTSLTGRWQYDGFFFEGHRYPNPNPDLTVQFTFYGEKSSHLIWHRKGDPGSCERKGIYEQRGEYLYQKVTWLNPKNLAECGRDPDMQLGRETLNRFEILPDELRLFFDLNGKEFIYILRRCGPPETECPGFSENFSVSLNI